MRSKIVDSEPEGYNTDVLSNVPAISPEIKGVGKLASVTILIADDEARMRKLISDFLKKEGYGIIEAVDGKEALEIFHSHGKSLSLVILDVMMPGCDGWTVCREIRRTSKIPIIMLTARSEEGDELFGFDLGADEYVTKPFSPLILVARVQEIGRASWWERV